MCTAAYIENYLVKPATPHGVKRTTKYVAITFRVIRFTILPRTVCIRASTSFDEITMGRNSSIQLAFRSVFRKAPSPWRTLDTFPTEVRRFRIPAIEEIRISPAYSGATGFCCKRIPFVLRSSPGVGSYPGCCTYYRLFSRLIHELLRVIGTSKALLVVRVPIVFTLTHIRWWIIRKLAYRIRSLLFRLLCRVAVIFNLIRKL